MKIGLTYDRREDYSIEHDSEIFADFCSDAEVVYLAEAIKQCGHSVELIGNMFSLNKQIKEGSFSCDMVFIEDEGILSRNRELMVPAILELNNIPYIGSDAYAMGLSQNKLHTKLVAGYLNIKTPKCLCIPYKQEDIGGFLRCGMEREQMGFPAVIKPNYEGYSMGVFLVHSIEEALEKIEQNMCNYKQDILCEQYIKGKEVYVPIVGTGERAYHLGVGEALHDDGSDIDIFTLHHKCFEPIIDRKAEISEELYKELTEKALLIHRHLGCFDFGRSDFKIDGSGEAYFIEINPRPGLTQNGPYEAMAKSIGKSYTQIIGEIIDSAVLRYRGEI